jgi:hypothetical protein
MCGPLITIVICINLVTFFFVGGYGILGSAKDGSEATNQ